MRKWDGVRAVNEQKPWLREREFCRPVGELRLKKDANTTMQGGYRGENKGEIREKLNG